MVQSLVIITCYPMLQLNIKKKLLLNINQGGWPATFNWVKFTKELELLTSYWHFRISLVPRRLSLFAEV